MPGGYCIDSTEVTRDQYAAWLATNPATDGQVVYCWWNDDYTPMCEWPPGIDGNYPVVCVDWCDAYAYCAGVGKRLCGRIGGGSNWFTDYADATRSQWFSVCSSGGLNEFTYGNEYLPETCNGYNAQQPFVPVGTMQGCSSPVPGYEGVNDLVGNVSEWEDSCDKGNGFCRLRGGASGYGVGKCGEETSIYRNNKWDKGGFRCCADL